jgi:hypothetical protein
MSSGEWSDFFPVGLAVLFYFALLAAGMVAARRGLAKRLAMAESERRSLPYA